MAVAASSLCLLIALNETNPGTDIPLWLTTMLSVCLLWIRITAFATSAINFSLTVELTPTDLQGLTFGIVNTVSRGITIFSPVVAELVTNGSWTCAIFAIAGIIAVQFMVMGTKYD